MQYYWTKLKYVELTVHGWETLDCYWKFLLWNNTHIFHMFLLVKAICRLSTLTRLCHKTCPNVILRHRHASGEQKFEKWTELTEQKQKRRSKLNDFLLIN